MPTSHAAGKGQSGEKAIVFLGDAIPALHRTCWAPRCHGMRRSHCAARDRLWWNELQWFDIQRHNLEHRRIDDGWLQRIGSEFIDE